MRPVILDFDHSVGSLAGASVVPLQAWQEAVRFGCSLRRMRELADAVTPQLPDPEALVLLGSGDFHHVSRLLIGRIAQLHPVEIVVIDNHPDNMRFPFGIHCGSWVRHVALLPRVTHVHVLGITSTDVSAASLWENYLSPLRQGRLTYWCVGIGLRWIHRVQWRAAFRTFPNPAALLRAFREQQRQSAMPIYLSIDKDALSPQVVHTNWDQGCMSEADLHAVIDIVGHRICAGDITGDVSIHRYRTRWKRWLTARDRQPDIPPGTLAQWQHEHHEVNERLVRKLLTVTRESAQMQ